MATDGPRSTGRVKACLLREGLCPALPAGGVTDCLSVVFMDGPALLAAVGGVIAPDYRPRMM